MLTRTEPLPLPTVQAQPIPPLTAAWKASLRRGFLAHGNPQDGEALIASMERHRRRRLHSEVSR